MARLCFKSACVVLMSVVCGCGKRFDGGNLFLDPSQMRPLFVPQNAQLIPERYIVVMHEDEESRSSVPLVLELVSLLGGEVQGFWEGSLVGFGAYLPQEVLHVVRTLRSVRLVEQDQKVMLSSEQTAPVGWNLDRVDQTSASLDGVYAYDADGEDVWVYVVDSGVNVFHEDFQLRAVPGFTAVHDAYGFFDCNGHGTHVAGIVGGVRSGVAKHAVLWSVRVSGCDGTSSFAHIIEGLSWVLEHHRASTYPAVVNMSLGGILSPSLNQAVQAVWDAGITVVVAAGNDGIDACRVSPASVPAVLTVGSSGMGDTVMSGSNKGRCVDLYAPGVDVLSASGMRNTYALRTGTSMSAAMVSGVAALYLQRHPNATPSEVSEALLGYAQTNSLKNLPVETPDVLLNASFNKPRAEPWSLVWEHAEPWNPFEHPDVLSVMFVSRDIGYATTADGSILTTTAAGRVWWKLREGAWNDVFFFNSRFAYAVGDAGAVWRTDDRDQAWYTQKAGVLESLFSVWFVDPQTGWIVGDYGSVLNTQDGGRSWLRQSVPVSVALNHVFFKNARVGWATGGEGVFLYTEEGGLQWRRVDIEGVLEGEVGNVVCVEKAETGFSVAGKGTVLVGEGCGGRWVVKKLPTEEDLHAVAFVDEEEGWVVGDKGTVFRTWDGGNSWHRQNAGTEADLYDVFFTDSTHGWIAGSSGVLLYSRASYEVRVNP